MAQRVPKPSRNPSVFRVQVSIQIVQSLPKATVCVCVCVCVCVLSRESLESKCKANREAECLVCSALRATIEELSLENSALSRQLADARSQNKEREEQLEIYQSALDAAEKQV